MIVKIMSAENAADGDCRKQFSLYGGVNHVEFVRQADTGAGDNAIALVDFDNGQTRELYCYGNVYVMNDAGKTVSCFGIAQLPPDGSAGQAPSVRTA